MELLLALVIGYLGLRGVCEGMVMTRYTDPMCKPDAPDDMDGVRCHRWFRWYHLLTVWRDVWAGVIGAVVWKWGVGDLGVMGAMGAMVVGWEVFEVAYGVVRYGRVELRHENVMGVKSVDGLVAVCGIHLARILVGIALIWGGMT